MQQTKITTFFRGIKDAATQCWIDDFVEAKFAAKNLPNILPYYNKIPGAKEIIDEAIGTFEWELPSYGCTAENNNNIDNEKGTQMWAEDFMVGWFI